MFREWVEKILRARYGFAMLVVGAMAVLTLNEMTYRNSTFALTRGIRLTDIRIKAAQTLQLVTDAESSVRGYVITGNPEHLAVYLKALKELPLVSDEAFHLIAEVSDGQDIPVDQVKALMAARMGELALLHDMKKAGKDAETNAMLMTDVGTQKMMALREAFDVTLKTAAGVQNVARVSLYEAMALTRWAVHMLMLATLTGLYFFMRQLIQNDRQRETENERLEKLAQKRTQELRELAGHLVTAREDERRRVARELHDDLGGLLTATKLDLTRIKRHEGLDSFVQERLLSIESRVNQGIALKRQIVENLRPSALDQLGLVSSLELLCKDMGHGMGIPVVLNAAEVSVSSDVGLTLYRVVQESLTNIAKHAQAQQVSVRLEATGSHVQLCVQDDGRGFDVNRVAHGHHGLVGLRYRVESHQGTLVVTSSPSAGTRLLVVIPVPVTACAAELAAA